MQRRFAVLPRITFCKLTVVIFGRDERLCELVGLRQPGVWAARDSRGGPSSQRLCDSAQRRCQWSARLERAMAGRARSRSRSPAGPAAGPFGEDWFLNDPVHGSIVLPALCRVFVDTPEFQRMWEYYLKVCEALFELRINQLWQFVFSPRPTFRSSVQRVT